MKFSSGFLSVLESENEGSSSADNYLRYTKLEQSKPANFCLLEQDPLEYWLVWGQAKTDGSMKPFRFLEEPSGADIEAEFGSTVLVSTITLYLAARTTTREFASPVNACAGLFTTGMLSASKCLRYLTFPWRVSLPSTA